MRIQAQIGLFGILARASLLCLSTSVGWSETNSASNVADASLEEKPGKPPETLISPQELQEQHQQLLQVMDLIRRDAELNLKRHTAAVERIRKDTQLSLQRFAAAIDVKVDRLNSTFASERELEIETFRRSNRFVVMTASVIVGMLLLEILFVAWISVRAVNQVVARMSAWASAQSSARLGVSPGWETSAANLAPENIAGETSPRLQNAIQQLEQRLLDLEHTATWPPFAAREPAAAPTSKAPPPQASSAAPARKHSEPSRVSLTLGDGESLIILPHKKRIPPFRNCGHFLQKLWKRIQPVRIAKGQ